MPARPKAYRFIADIPNEPFSDQDLLGCSATRVAWSEGFGENDRMKVYLAGPLFNDGERSTLSAIAARLRADGYDVFVPHEQFVEMEGLDEAKVFRTDLDGVRSANLMLCWIDGTQVDDGTAVEIGIFTQLCAQDPDKHRGIVALCTDLRMIRRRGVAGSRQPIASD